MVFKNLIFKKFVFLLTGKQYHRSFQMFVDNLIEKIQDHGWIVKPVDTILRHQSLEIGVTVG